MRIALLLVTFVARTTPNDGGVLADKLDLFAYWHGWRTAFQIAALVALLWALALRSPRPS
jgi:hypothetical protein